LSRTVREDESRRPKMIKKVLVGTDTSAAADLAVDAAAELARTNEAELVVVYASGNGSSTAFDPGKAPDPVTYLKDISRRFPTVATVAREEAGDPVEVLCQVAEREGADVIVVGNRGAHDKRRRYLRSVPNGVVHCAPCSVFVVDTRKAQ
jgi:nucleotide-binding universal stress UspA family protein